MVKIPRKIGVAIALTGLLVFGGLAYGVSKINFKSVKNDIKANVAPLQEGGNILLNDKLSGEFLNYEYQLLMGEYHSNCKEYQQAQNCYEEAIKSAKACLGEKSFFTSTAYLYKGHAEYRHRQYKEAQDDFAAALKALPEQEDYYSWRCSTESWLIYITNLRGRTNDLSLLRKHLALTQKLASDSDNDTDHWMLKDALINLAKGLDDEELYSKSEPLWEKWMNLVRSENESPKKFEPQLMEFAFHEIEAKHYPQAERALWEALRIASQENNDEMAAGVLEARGEMRLRRNELDTAEHSFKTALDLRKKFKDDEALAQAYDNVSEIYRRQGKPEKRAEALKVALQLTEESEQKADYQFELACIAAQCKQDSQIKDYSSLWKQTAKKNTRNPTFIVDQDLQRVKELYPQLVKDLSDLDVYKYSLNRSGYFLDYAQVNKFLDVISSSKPASSH